MYSETYGKQKASKKAKLKFFCQMCRKQCMDENGFRCHLDSDHHMKMMMRYNENPEMYIEQFSKEFKDAFLELMREKFKNEKVSANKVFMEMIKKVDHVHLNGTRWAKLGEFIQEIHSQLTIIAEPYGPQDYLISLPQQDKKQVKKENKVKKATSLIDKSLEQQIQRGLALEKEQQERNQDNKELKEVTQQIDGPISFSLTLPTVNLVQQQQPELIDQRNRWVEEDCLKQQNNPNMEKLYNKIKNKQTESEIEKPITQSEDLPWVHEGIVVKILEKQLQNGKFYNKKGVIKKVVDDFGAQIEIKGEKIILDQKFLQTVVPSLQHKVMILKQGQWRGKIGILESIHQDNYSGSVFIEESNQLVEMGFDEFKLNQQLNLMLHQKNYSVASQQIEMILYEDKLCQRGSMQFIELLHMQSILQFNLRKYQDSEISLQNAMIQTQSQNDEDRHKALIQQYYLLTSFTNPDEIHQNYLSEIWKTHYKSDKRFIATLKSFLGVFEIENDEIFKDAVSMLKSSTLLYTHYGFQNYFNIAVLHFLFQQNKEKEIAMSICIAFNYLYKTKYETLEDIWQFYCSRTTEEFKEDDIKVCIFVAQFLLKLKETKLALNFLNLSYKIAQIQPYYLPEIKLIYSAYFYEINQKQSSMDLCDSIQSSNLHPLQDYLKINSMRLVYLCSQENQQQKYQSGKQPQVGAHRQKVVKQQDNKPKLEDQIMDYAEQKNIMPASRYYYQFRSQLKQVYSIENVIVNDNLFI